MAKRVLDCRELDAKIAPVLDGQSLEIVSFVLVQNLLGALDIARTRGTMPPSLADLEMTLNEWSRRAETWGAPRGKHTKHV